MKENKNINNKCQYCEKQKGIQKHKGRFSMCSRHKSQMFVYGKILKRTVHDKNEYRIKDGVVFMTLRDIKKRKVAEVLFDLFDLERVIQRKWCMTSHGYASSGYPFRIYLHRFLMDVPPLMEIDHKNSNRLDNRRANLRICTHSQNIRNQNNLKGIHFDRSKQRWKVHIVKDGKIYYFGSFKSEKEALQRRIEKEKELWGEFAPFRSTYAKDECK